MKIKRTSKIFSVWECENCGELFDIDYCRKNNINYCCQLRVNPNEYGWIDKSSKIVKASTIHPKMKSFLIGRCDKCGHVCDREYIKRNNLKKCRYCGDRNKPTILNYRVSVLD